MSAPAFSPADRSTWPELLTAEQVAELWQRKVSGLKKSCQKHRFIPAPFQVRPYLWRKVDVLRFVDTPRTSLRRAG